MKNTKALLFIFAAVVFAISSAASAEDRKLQEDRNTPRSFDDDASDAAAKMRESLRLMRQSKFFSRLYGIIDKGDVKSAEGLLKKRLREVPSDKNSAAYLVAKSRISYAKRDYPTAYAEADRFISELEKSFKPEKPYEVDFEDKNARDSVRYAYILRYQAAAALMRYEDALEDLNSAQRLETNSELLRAKTGALLALGRYTEAAAAADGAYELNKDAFKNSPYRDHYCWLFSEHGCNNVKYCGYFAALAKERAAARQGAK